VTTKEKARVSAEPSLSTAMQEVGADLARLVRQEVQLAKAELAQEMRQAVRGAGLLAGAGFAAVMAVLLGPLASAYGVGSHLGLGWGTLVVSLFGCSSPWRSWWPVGSRSAGRAPRRAVPSRA
jgi:hypothetical protein